MPVASTNTASTLSRRASSATFAALHRVGKAQFDRHDAASVPASSKGDRTLVLALPRNIDTDHQRIAHSGHQLLQPLTTVDELHQPARGNSPRMDAQLSRFGSFENRDQVGRWPAIPGTVTPTEPLFFRIGVN
jgi:hypothetical protein